MLTCIMLTWHHADLQAPPQPEAAKRTAKAAPIPAIPATIAISAPIPAAVP
jgi:hypothetical protein